jgi:hypothetical protein
MFEIIRNRGNWSYHMLAKVTHNDSRNPHVQKDLQLYERILIKLQFGYFVIECKGMKKKKKKELCNKS